jgi:hypothetical protein
MFVGWTERGMKIFEIESEFLIHLDENGDYWQTDIEEWNIMGVIYQREVGPEICLKHRNGFISIDIC